MIKIQTEKLKFENKSYFVSYHYYNPIMIKLGLIFTVAILVISASSFNLHSLIDKLDKIPKTWQAGKNSKFESLSL